MKQIIEEAMQEIGGAIKEWVMKIKAGGDGYKEAHEVIRQSLEEVYMKGRNDAVDYIKSHSRLKNSGVADEDWYCCKFEVLNKAERP